MWYFNDLFRYMFKAKLVPLVSLKVPAGNCIKLDDKVEFHGFCKLFFNSLNLC